MTNLTKIRDDLMRSVFNDWASPGVLIRPLHGRPLPEDFAVDIREDDQKYILEAEMPGLKKDDIQIDIDGAQVSIKAEVRQYDQKVENERTVQTERYFGSVARRFVFQSEIDSAGSQAVYRDGVLFLTLPKKSSFAAKRLEVH